MEWRKKLAEARKLDPQDERKWEVTAEFAEALGAQFLEGHQCVQKRNERLFELRGRFQDHPARMQISMTFLIAHWQIKARTRRLRR